MQTNNEFGRYLKNTLWLFSEKITKMGINFFVIILLTRYLGPENYGLLSYSQSLVGIFVAFSTLGLEVILVRELTKNKNKSDVILGTAFALKLFVSVISIFIVLLINLNSHDTESVILTNIIVFSLLFQSLNLGIETYFQANILSRLTSISNMVVTIISSLTKIGLIYLEADLVYFAYVLVFDSFLIFVGYAYIFYNQKKSVGPLKYDGQLAIYFIKTSWPLLMVAMAVFLYTKIDLIMIKHLVDNESVGNYMAAVKVSEIFYFIPLLITQSIFPKIVEVKQRNEDEYFELLEKTYKYLIWSTIPLAFGVFIFSDMIVTILYGDQYTQASSILRVLSFAVILNAIGAITTKVLYVENYERKYLYRSLLGMCVNIVLNFLLIGLYGAFGAAISTIITLFVIYYVYDLFDKDLHKFFYLKVQCFLPFKLRKLGIK
jgi:O-antigen/teichoic acid export membrane protein